MDAVQQLRRLFLHNAWADDLLFAALLQHTENAEAWREYAHIIAVQAIWLDRIMGRQQRIAVWPSLSPDEVGSLRTSLQGEYNALLSSLESDQLERTASYVNTAGLAFTTPIGEILLHTALHGQYHRGKVNVLLRQNGAEPAPVDYISFSRGVPAATTPLHQK